MNNMQLKQHAERVLQKDKRLWTKAGELDQTLLLELLEKTDSTIIALLLGEEVLRDKFFVKISSAQGNGYVFKMNDFRFFMEENKTDNSYTQYKNRIGLTDGKRFLKDTNDVVLDFPFKDCVLEGGQSSEEGTDVYFEYDETATQGASKTYNKKQSKRKEIFFNTILAQDEIDRLFDQKAFVNWTRYSKEYNMFGGGGGLTLKRTPDGTLKENLIIKGNNLIALHSLKKQFAGKIKLIYIDPPYNTGNDGFKYNDNFNHSAWLTFMKNRLEVAKSLLSSDGSIYINIDQKESHYLKLLCDDIFGKSNFQNEIIWLYSGGTDRIKGFNRKHDNIFFYSKTDKFLFHNIYEPFSEATIKRFNKTDESGKKYKENKLADGRVTRTYMKEEGKKVPDYWNFPIVNRTYEEYCGIDGQKPESLIERIIRSATNPNDIVLDYHLGSGTTAAVAHKMGRQYIGIEQMDYIEDIAVERLKKVIGITPPSKDGTPQEGNYDKGGISKSVGWQGGGEFLYCELAEWNEKAKAKILEQKDFASLKNFFQELYETYFLSYNLKTKEFVEKTIEEENFMKLTLDEQKAIFIAMLDNNQMYINKSEMADEKFAISQEDQELTAQFYNEGQ